MADVKTISDKVVNYDELTKRLKETMYAKLPMLTPFVSCIRKTANNTYQVEFLERKPAASETTDKGINLTFLLNRKHDDRFREFVRVQRAWAIFTTKGALIDLIGKNTLSEADFNALDAIPEGSKDRLGVMKTLPTINHEGQNYALHVVVTEVRKDEMESGDIALNNSQKQSLEHENAVKRTGGENNEFLVCALTGSKVLQITEIKAMSPDANLATMDTLIPNQVPESTFLKSSASNGSPILDADKVSDALFGGN